MNMSKQNFVILFNNREKQKYSREDLVQHSGYFRALFDSGMKECQSGLLRLSNDSHRYCLSVSEGSDGFIISLIMKCLNSNHNRTVRPRLKWFMKLFKRGDSRLIPAKHGVMLLSEWLDQASYNQVEQFLRAVSYFQFLGIIPLLKSCYKKDNLKDTSRSVHFKVAVKVCPFAFNCGLFELHDLACESAANFYIEFLQSVATYKHLFSENVLRSIKGRRFGLNSEESKKCNANSDFLVLFRTDIDYIYDVGLSFEYALVSFSNNMNILEQDELSWKPLLIDQFKLNLGESVIQAVTVHNYLFVLTTTYDESRDESYVKVYTFNPFVAQTKDFKIPKFSSPDVKSNFDSGESKKQTYSIFSEAWRTNLSVLTKPGNCQNCRVIVAHGPSKYSDEVEDYCIYLLGWNYSVPVEWSHGDSSCPMNTTALDVDRYNPISDTWTECSSIPLYKWNGSMMVRVGGSKDSKKRGFLQRKVTETTLISMLSKTDDEKILVVELLFYVVMPGNYGLKTERSTYFCYDTEKDSWQKVSKWSCSTEIQEIITKSFSQYQPSLCRLLSEDTFSTSLLYQRRIALYKVGQFGVEMGLRLYCDQVNTDEKIVAEELVKSIINNKKGDFGCYRYKVDCWYCRVPVERYYANNASDIEVVITTSSVAVPVLLKLFFPDKMDLK